MIIRTVFQPGEELEVSDEDAEVLRLQGLLHIPAAAPPATAIENAGSEPEPEADPAPEVADLPAAAAVAKPGPAKTDPPAATGAPTDQAPVIEKG